MATGQPWVNNFKEIGVHDQQYREIAIRTRIKIQDTPEITKTKIELTKELV